MRTSLPHFDALAEPRPKRKIFESVLLCYFSKRRAKSEFHEIRWWLVDDSSTAHEWSWYAKSRFDLASYILIVSISVFTLWNGFEFYVWQDIRLVWKTSKDNCYCCRLPTTLPFIARSFSAQWGPVLPHLIRLLKQNPRNSLMVNWRLLPLHTNDCDLHKALIWRALSWLLPRVSLPCKTGAPCVSRCKVVVDYCYCCRLPTMLLFIIRSFSAKWRFILLYLYAPAEPRHVILGMLEKVTFAFSILLG